MFGIISSLCALSLTVIKVLRHDGHDPEIQIQIERSSSGGELSNSLGSPSSSVSLLSGFSGMMLRHDDDDHKYKYRDHLVGD